MAKAATIVLVLALAVMFLIDSAYSDAPVSMEGVQNTANQAAGVTKDAASDASNKGQDMAKDAAQGADNMKHRAFDFFKGLFGRRPNDNQGAPAAPGNA